MSPAILVSSTGATLTGFFSRAAGASASGRAAASAGAGAALSGWRAAEDDRSRIMKSAPASSATPPTPDHSNVFFVFVIVMAHPQRDRGRWRTPTADRAFRDTGASPRSRRARSG